MFQRLKMKITILFLPALLLAGEGFALVTPHKRGGGRGRRRRLKKAALRKQNFCPRVTGFENPEAAVEEFVGRNPEAKGKVAAFRLPGELLAQLQKVEAEYAELGEGAPTREVQSLQYLLDDADEEFRECLEGVKTLLFAKMIEMESSRIGGESSEIERVEKKMSAKNDFFRAQFLDSEVSGTPSTLDQTLNSNSDGARLAREFLDQFGDCGAGNWVGPGPKNSANFEANANSFNTPQPWHQDGMPQGGQYLVLITVNTPDGLDTQKTGTWIGTSDLLSGSEAWISFPENGEQTGDAAAQEAVALSGPMNKCHNRKKIFGSKARPPLIAGDPELDQEAHFQLVGPYEDAKPLSDTGMRGTDTRQGPAAAESYLPVRDVKQKLLKTPSSCDPRMVLVPGPPGTVLIIRNYELAHAGPQMILSGKKEWSYEEVREKCCDQQRRTLLRLNI